MIRVAFTMRLKPGGLAEYRRHHCSIWPELVAELERAGIRNMTIFENDPVLFLYSEVEDEGSWERLWSTETHERWGQLMEPLMALKDGGSHDSTTLREVFHVEPASWEAPSPWPATRGSWRRPSASRPGPRAASRASPPTWPIRPRSRHSATRSGHDSARQPSW